MNTLDSWEAEANNAPRYQGEARPLIQQYRMRVLVLIKALRIALSSFKFIADFDEEIQPPSIDRYAAREALEEIEAILKGESK